MDCCENVDDYCDARQPANLQIPETVPWSNLQNLDQFFITFEVETTFPLDEDEDEDEDEGVQQFVRVEDRNLFTFWAPCPRFKHQNLTRERISSMLSRVGVALHKQDFMVDAISLRADEIANAARNKASRVLPLFVSISIVACSCYSRPATHQITAHHAHN